jgi:hypothetical protein
MLGLDLEMWLEKLKESGVPPVEVGRALALLRP